MAKQFHVFSTLTCDNRYVRYAQGGDMPIAEHSVLIRGGTGVANDRLITPVGVMTTISEQDMEALRDNPLFKLHQANGFITVRERSADPEKVASDMVRADKSAPLTPANFTDPNGVQTKS